MGALAFIDPATMRVITSLTRQVRIIMSTIADLETTLTSATATLNAVASNVENISGDVAALTAEINTLKAELANAQIPAGAQAAIDNLGALAASLSTRTAGIAAQTADQPNPV